MKTTFSLLCFATLMASAVEARNWQRHSEDRQKFYKLRKAREEKQEERRRKQQLKNPLVYDSDAGLGEFPLQHFNYPDYIDKKASEKMEDLWAACQADSTTQPFPWVEWGGLFNQDLGHSFERGDEMPEGVKKLSHTQGLVAKVSWEPIDGASGYTGMMGTGSENILMRFSETSMLHEESRGLTPSVAFKILRDGTFSDNVLAMPSFESSDSWNFFEKPMLTRVDSFKENSCGDLSIKKKFGEGSRFVFACGNSDLTIHNEDGTRTQDQFDWDRPFPWILSFEANEPYKSMFSSDKEFDQNGRQVSWLDQLQQIDQGSELFTVRGLTAPPGHEGSEWVDIATIRLTTELQTSKFGDERLFFQHIMKEDDNPFMPVSWWQYDHAVDPVFANHLRKNQWRAGVPEPDSEGGWPSDEAGAKTMFMEQQEQHGCPFYWLIEYAQSL